MAGGRPVPTRRPAAEWPGRGPPRPDTRPGGRPLPPVRRPTRSIPFFFRLRIDDPHDAALALALRRARRAPRPRALIGTTGVLEHAADGGPPEPREGLAAERPLERTE